MLSIIAMYLKNFGLGIDHAIEILSTIVKKYNLAISNYMSLVDDLESSNVIETHHKSIAQKKQKNKNRFQTRAGVIQESCFVFLHPNQMFKLCLSNKSFFQSAFQKIQRKLLKQDFFEQSQHILLWQKSLGIHPGQYNFDQFNNANLFLDKTTEDVLRVDVLRTFTHDKTFEKDTLFSVLRCGTLALQNGVGYCQGMNYIAGMFLYLNQNQNEAFDLYVSLIQQKLGSLFENNFQQMKVYFYVLENVMFIFVNEIAIDFKSKKIIPGYFCSSWFITLFSSAFQYTKKSYLVLSIIDLFIAEGFKAILKAIIAILGFYKKKLIGKSFEETMEFMSEFIQQEIFKNSQLEDYMRLKKSKMPASDLKSKFKHADEYEFVLNFKSICKKIKITNGLISKLEERYYSLGSKLNRL